MDGLANAINYNAIRKKTYFNKNTCPVCTRTSGYKRTALNMHWQMYSQSMCVECKTKCNILPAVPNYRLNTKYVDLVVSFSRNIWMNKWNPKLSWRQKSRENLNDREWQPAGTYYRNLVQPYSFIRALYKQVSKMTFVYRCTVW